jgi:hypothetical protein
MGREYKNLEQFYYIKGSQFSSCREAPKVSRVPTLTGGISNKFSDAEQSKVSNYGQFIIATCRQGRKIYSLLSAY